MSAKQVNIKPIYPKLIDPRWAGTPLNTYEIECSECHRAKWPSLPDRPSTYVCSLCRMAGSGARNRREAGRRGGRASNMARIERKRSLGGAQ